ncbi:hypothetical protein [Natronobeatus ordinarius]|uniref:hypothetical protein n=1 Tax=Natronobeatus ordinarius TaxID=2963433 RepID=UPI0020CD935C|nr:hypothetical protein [Natronobeatus ordinarius]
MSESDADSRGEPSAAEDATDEQPPEAADDAAEATAQVELLAAENRRLRSQYARLRQARYRRTALGLAFLGGLAALGGLLLPDGREVLFALAATGLFGAVLTYSLAPGRVVAADVGERIHAAAATNGAAIADALGLADEHVYLPTTDTGGVGDAARLYVPQQAGDDLLEALSTPADRDGLEDRRGLEDVTGPFVTDDERRGLVLEPTGGPLYREFERELVDDLESTPVGLTTQLADALVEGFELADAATPDVDAGDGRATVALTGSVLGDVDRFDHPIASFLAVGLAAGLERPVSLEIAPGDDRADWLVTCRWVPEE